MSGEFLRSTPHIAKEHPLLPHPVILQCHKTRGTHHTKTKNILVKEQKITQEGALIK